ncbi:hypothetical protein KJ657_01435 [Patescibacteria group bacterium]|nr:hypothetical protein [Patescibacteria group bacterium]MBU1015731.1 hypothetical protein [Patescibacteria group bacterium]MBU1684903.1 hypothetical protein [Patescibacteria group bacterium]MBU1938639.1 hypothetical protein [Patescibacteria group bacterium]
MRRANSNKGLSEFLFPVFVAGIFALFIVVGAYAASDTVNLTINVANVAPSVGSPTDNGSSTATPTNVGTNVTFSTTATDPGGDGYWLAVCKTGGTITPDAGGGAPTCTAGDWCISSSAVASGAQNSCTYGAQQSDAMSNAWEAYACDDNAAGSACSSVSTGDSPFNVNHPPVIGTVVIGPSYGSSASVDPGNGGTGEVYFRVGVTDPDSEAPQDTIDMYACSSATTSFDASTGTCTGGSLLCSVTDVTTGTNADCTDADLASIPTAHGSHNVKIYLRDNSSTKLADDGSNNAQAYTVTDVTPTISGLNIGSNPLIPSAGGSVTQSYTATVSDDNGYADVDSAFGAIYVAPATLTGNGVCSTASEINCYDVSSCELSGGSGTNVTVTCGTGGTPLTTWFNIFPSDSWKAHISVLGTPTIYSFATEGTFTVNALSAVNVAEGNIPYGPVALGGTSASQPTTLQNAGNIVIDVLIQGSDMASNGDTISRIQQHWAPVTGFTWGTDDYALLETASVGSAVNGCSDRSIPVTTDHTNYTTSQIFWKIKIPDIQAAGSYTGTNYFIATPDDCSGGI